MLTEAITLLEDQDIDIPLYRKVVSRNKLLQVEFRRLAALFRRLLRSAKARRTNKDTCIFCAYQASDSENVMQTLAKDLEFEYLTGATTLMTCQSCWYYRFRDSDSVRY
jgi:hypothetical protein